MGNSNPKEFFDFDHGKVKPKKGFLPIMRYFFVNHFLTLFPPYPRGLGQKLMADSYSPWSKTPECKKFRRLKRFRGFLKIDYIWGLCASANFQYFGSKTSKIRSFSVIFLLTKFGGGGYRMRYRATEMDINSISGELLKYVNY
jgi:hypothetical protein